MMQSAWHGVCTSWRAGGLVTPGKTIAQLERELFAGPLWASLLRRFVQPSEVANLVVLLTSEQASATTGAALRVDGGIIRSIP